MKKIIKTNIGALILNEWEKFLLINKSQLFAIKKTNNIYFIILQTSSNLQEFKISWVKIKARLKRLTIHSIAKKLKSKHDQSIFTSKIIYTCAFFNF